MARLAMLALASCGMLLRATPEPMAPACSYARITHSDDKTSAVTWLPERATCYWASKPKTSTCVLDTVCSRADSAARARSHDATGAPDVFGEAARAAYDELAHDAMVPWAPQPMWARAS